MLDSLSVLVVTTEPDDRRSTEVLKILVEEMDRRPNLRAEVWYLFGDPKRAWAPGHTVDRLRTWWLNRILEGVGLTMVAGWARGARLRRWFRALDPGLIILNDGYGGRLLTAAPPGAVIAVRTNQDAVRAEFEPEPLADASLLISSRALRPDDRQAAGWLTNPSLREMRLEKLRVTRAPGSHDRESLGIPDDVPLIVGWGHLDWVDGPDMFVRALWYLEHRHGVVAHGVWFGPTDVADAVRPLEDEAARCGVSDRFHLVEDDERADHWVGDVAFLPYRVPIDESELWTAVANNVAVVTFEPAEIEGFWIRSVPLLDVASGAGAIADFLRQDRSYASDFDPTRWVDRLLELTADLQDR
jgi:hypothetical protein